MLSSRSLRLRPFAGLFVVGILASATAACSDGGTVASAPSTRTPVVLDYSPTVSDVGALLYLAANDDIDLLAVTLPGTGEADCEHGVRSTRALLSIARHETVPVGCGRDEPLIGERDWPAEWRERANSLPRVLLPRLDDEPILDAEELLAEVLAAADVPVTIVAVGPLTNLGAVLHDEPASAERIERVVIMGGAIDVDGNVEAAPSAEWNLYIDPEAARLVLAAEVDVLMVPLDATNQLPWTQTLVARLDGLDTPVARAEHQLVSSRDALEGIFFWDELAAVAAMTPDLVTIEERRLIIDADGATIESEDGRVVDVAVGVDADAVAAEWLRVLNGGAVPQFPPLTAAELTYLDSLTEAVQGMQRSSATVWSSDPSTQRPEDVIDTFWQALAVLHEALLAVEPPEAFVDRQAALTASVAELIDLEAEVRAGIASTDSADTWEALDLVFESSGAGRLFIETEAACRAISSESLRRGGPDVCAAPPE